MEYALKPLKAITGQPVTLSSDPTGELIQLDPDRNVKYVFVIDVGNLNPMDAAEHMQKMMNVLVGFLGPDRVLIMPKSSKQEAVQIFGLEPVTD